MTNLYTTSIFARLSQRTGEQFPRPGERPLLNRSQGAVLVTRSPF
jgi:hypothetical protein